MKCSRFTFQMSLVILAINVPLVGAVVMYACSAGSVSLL